MSNALPSRASLEQLKKRAKALRKSQESLTLAQAQLAVAREHGFPSWPKLKSHVESSRLTLAQKAQAFVEASLAGRTGRGKALLKEAPDLAAADIRVAALLGEADLVAKKPDPDLLSLVCRSRFHREDPKRAKGLLKTAKILLENGADANAFQPRPGYPGSKLGVLYAAVGIADHPALAEILLEAGADPNDGESLYHACESNSADCLKLLLKHGAREKGTNALKHSLDYEDMEKPRLLLEQGADPNEETGDLGMALHHAVVKGRGSPALELLVAHGARIDARTKNGQTAYALALRHGRSLQAAWLLTKGASDAAEAADRFLGACSRGDRGGMRSLLTQDPGLVRSLWNEGNALMREAAGQGRTAAVLTFLEAGFDEKDAAEGGTPIHYAAWAGYADTLNFLLERRPDLEALNSHGGTVLAAALHGAVHCRENGAGYVPIVKALLAAGAEMKPYFLDVEDETLANILRRNS